ncbi:MAG: DNA recombination protein RmuC, partial [Firmicutes bacterium]|nr:DNA recombination protein RmuC [Bacillota bacterium]
LAQQLKKEAKDIATKYVQTPYTTEFAVMFLPFEGLYAEAVNMGIMEDVQRNYRIMIAGPSTMAALLNSLQMGFKTLAIQQNADEVWRVLGKVKSEFDRFAEVLDATQHDLEQANKNLDKLVGTRTRMIQRTLKDVSRLGEYYDTETKDD